MRLSYYLVGRTLSVLTRPLSLLLVNNYLSKEASQGVAEVFLLTSLTMGWIAADPHRRFYRIHFSASTVSTILAFYSYFSSLFLLNFVGCIIIFCLIIYSTNSLWLAIFCIPYFISEKLADEVLRYNLFEKKFEKWGNLSLQRSLLQISSVLLLILVLGTSTSAQIIILFFSIIGVLIFVREFPHSFLHNKQWTRFRVIIHRLPRAVKLLRIDWILWAMTVVSAGIQYSDRLSIMFIERESLPLFTLVTMSFSIVPMFIDFFYLSKYRRDILSEIILIQDVIFNKQFARDITISILIAFLAAYSVLRISAGGSEFPFYYVFAIAAMSISAAIVYIPYEILYWKFSLRYIFLIDLSFLIVFSSILIIASRYGFSSKFIFLSLATCAFLRLMTYVIAVLGLTRLSGAEKS
jgi:hypothetical protein